MFYKANAQEDTLSFKKLESKNLSEDIKFFTSKDDEIVLLLARKTKDRLEAIFCSDMMRFSGNNLSSVIDFKIAITDTGSLAILLLEMDDNTRPESFAAKTLSLFNKYGSGDIREDRITVDSMLINNDLLYYNIFKGNLFIKGKHFIPITGNHLFDKFDYRLYYFKK